MKTNLDKSTLLLLLWIQALRRTKKSNGGEITLNQPQDERISLFVEKHLRNNYDCF